MQFSPRRHTGRSGFRNPKPIVLALVVSVQSEHIKRVTMQNVNALDIAISSTKQQVTTGLDLENEKYGGGVGDDDGIGKVPSYLLCVREPILGNVKQTALEVCY